MDKTTDFRRTNHRKRQVYFNALFRRLDNFLTIQEDISSLQSYIIMKNYLP